MENPQDALDGLVRLTNFVDGRRVPAASGQTFESVNPATNQAVALVPRSGQADVDAAVDAAVRAFPAWEALGFERRAAMLDRVAAAVEARLDTFARLESRDNGKPVSLATAVDIPRVVRNFRFFAEAVRQCTTDAVLKEEVGAVNYTQRAPLGVVGCISPFNLPLYLLSWKVAPALAMGNTVVCKPSEVTPMTAHLLAEAVADILPPGVFNVVSGLGREAGAPLVAHPDVPCVSFTGGTDTGRRIAAVAAPMFKKLSLELGGKNATIVFADADLERAAAGAVRAAFANQGQVCLCGSRLFVEKSAYDRFVPAFLRLARELKPGDPRTANFGSLVSLEHRAKVESYVRLARESGAEILLGGRRPEGLEPPLDQGAFYEPTVVAGLPADHRCATEEIFGPVVTVHTFEDEDELLRAVNGTEFGLAGSVWTSDLRRGHQVAHRMRTGMVWVNGWLDLRDLRVPFGGIKSSGVGREGGRHSLEAYSEEKNVCVRYFSG